MILSATMAAAVLLAQAAPAAAPSATAPAAAVPPAPPSTVSPAVVTGAKGSTASAEDKLVCHNEPMPNSRMTCKVWLLNPRAGADPAAGTREPRAHAADERPPLRPAGWARNAEGWRAAHGSL